MYEVIFYEDPRGNCPVGEWLDELKQKASTNKQSRVLLSQVVYQIERLKISGTRAVSHFVKHIHGEIWELRPGRHRILFFGWDGNNFVLLHQFLKTTNTTPLHEIEKAEKEMKDWKKRHK